MKIEISQALADRIKRNDKKLEGAEAVINRALCALEQAEKIPAAPRQESSSIPDGAVSERDIRQVKHGWKATLIEIMKTLEHRKDLFNTFLSRMLKRKKDNKKPKLIPISEDLFNDDPDGFYLSESMLRETSSEVLEKHYGVPKAKQRVGWHWYNKPDA